MSMKKDANSVNNPILSLCIPTNGAVNWVVPVIESIYAQKCEDELFEVIISDNVKNIELKEIVNNYGKSNLHYFPSDSQGFLNIVSSFQSAKGDFCKLINHRAIMKEGALQNLLALIIKHKDDQPVIYCTNGVLGGSIDTVCCRDLNELVWNLHYYCTAMGGIGIWRKDIQNLKDVEYNKMFPNTTILFEQRRIPSTYLLYNRILSEEQNGKGKGCYNLFHTFAVVFPDMLQDLKQRGRITQQTFEKVMGDLYGCLLNFYMNYVLWNPDKSFDLSNIHRSITTYYSEYDYWLLIFRCYGSYYRGKFYQLMIKIRNVVRKII